LITSLDVKIGKSHSGIVFWLVTWFCWATTKTVNTTPNCHPAPRCICNISYRLIDNYMRQPPALSSGIRISWQLISRVWTLRKVK
jgi:hypothetical protein